MRRILGVAAVLAALIGAAPAHALPVGEISQDVGVGGCDPANLQATCDLTKFGPIFGIAPDTAEGFYAITQNGLHRFLTNADGTHTENPLCSSTPGAGCPALRGLGSPTWLLETPDGTGVLVGGGAPVGVGGAGVVSLVRDPVTGVLTQPDGPGFCLTHAPVAGCGSMRMNSQLLPGRTMTPDGASLYEVDIASRAAWQVFSVNRDPATGALSEGPCASSDGTDGAGGVCTAGPAAGGVVDVAGSNVALYVAVQCTLGGCPYLIEMRRSGADHQLTLEPGLDACIGPIAACRDPGALTTPAALQVLPKGALALWNHGVDSYVLVPDSTTGVLAAASTAVAVQTDDLLFAAPAIISPDGYAYIERGSWSIAPLTDALTRLTSGGAQSVLPAPQFGFVVTASHAVDVATDSRVVRRFIREVPPECSSPSGSARAYAGKEMKLLFPCIDRNPGDGPNLTVSVPPAHGVVALDIGTTYGKADYRYTADAGYVGPDSFTVDAADATSVVHLVFHVDVHPSPALQLVSLTGKGFFLVGHKGATPIYAVSPLSPVLRAILALRDDTGATITANVGPLYSECQATFRTGQAILFQASPPAQQFCVSGFPATAPLTIGIRTWPYITLFYRPAGNKVRLLLHTKPAVMGTAFLYRRAHGRWKKVSRGKGTNPFVTMKRGHTRGTWEVLFVPSDPSHYYPSALVFKIKRELASASSRAQSGLGIPLRHVRRRPGR